MLLTRKPLEPPSHKYKDMYYTSINLKTARTAVLIANKDFKLQNITKVKGIISSRGVN